MVDNGLVRLKPPPTRRKNSSGAGRPAGALDVKPQREYKTTQSKEDSTVSKSTKTAAPSSSALGSIAYSAAAVSSVLSTMIVSGLSAATSMVTLTMSSVASMLPIMSGAAPPVANPPPTATTTLSHQQPSVLVNNNDINNQLIGKDLRRWKDAERKRKKREFERQLKQQELDRKAEELDDPMQVNDILYSSVPEAADILDEAEKHQHKRLRKSEEVNRASSYC
jgi:hypothetical protein